jgi:flagellum-specific ATP synthase
LAGKLRKLLSAWRDAKDLVEIGAYVPGTNEVADEAIAKRSVIESFLQQDVEEQSDWESTWEALREALS